MSSLPQSTEQRLNRLVDRQAYLTDAQYHATVSTFRSWLEMTQMALRDEGVEGGVVERILNRIVYGHPSGAEAYERIDMFERHKEMLENMPPRPQVISDLLNGPAQKGRIRNG